MSNAPAIPEKAYHNLADLAREAAEMLSAPAVSPVRLREVYIKYTEALRQMQGVARELYARARVEFLDGIKDLTALRDVLEHPLESPVQVQVMEPISQRALAIARDDSVEARIDKYKGQIDSRVWAKVEPLMGQYVSGPTIRGITGYEPHELYVRAKKGNLPTTGNRASKRYLINESTIPFLFGIAGKAATPMRPRGEEFVEEIAASYEEQINPKIRGRVRGLIGTYIDAATICGIAGYDNRILRARVKENNIPMQGRTRWTRYLVNESTIPILFGERNVMALPADSTRRPASEKGVWMNQRDIQREFGYFNKGEAYEVLKAHPEVERRAIVKKGVRSTLYLITPEVSKFFIRTDGKTSVAATIRESDAPRPQQKGLGSPAGSIDDKLEASTKAPDAAGETLTYDQMIAYFNEQFGEKGPAMAVETLEQHSDDIQAGANRFLKDKLDEIIGATSKRI